jgi:hypothetical protein
MALVNVLEDPAQYRLIVGWDSIDDHMVAFRNSDDFQIWRDRVGRFFVVSPGVEHVALVQSYFRAATANSAQFF